MPHKISKWLEIAIKVFFIGLLVQFFLQTFVTYQLGREGGIWSLIWLWKELLILLFAGILGVALFALCKKEGIKSLWVRFLQLEVFRFFVFFLVACGISFFLAVFVQKVGLGTFILSFKYNLLGFLIFLLGGRFGVCIALWSHAFCQSISKTAQTSGLWRIYLVGSDLFHSLIA